MFTLFWLDCAEERKLSLITFVVRRPQVEGHGRGVELNDGGRLVDFLEVQRSDHRNCSLVVVGSSMLLEPPFSGCRIERRLT